MIILKIKYIKKLIYKIYIRIGIKRDIKEYRLIGGMGGKKGKGKKRDIKGKDIKFACVVYLLIRYPCPAAWIRSGCNLRSSGKPRIYAGLRAFEKLPGPASGSAHKTPK